MDVVKFNCFNGMDDFKMFGVLVMVWWDMFNCFELYDVSIVLNIWVDLEMLG